MMASTSPVQLSNSQLTSRFETLPFEIRQAVYGHLLKADVVRHGLDNHQVAHYRFETAILMTNKNIYNETFAFLYGHNVFVKVSSNWENPLPRTDLGHQIPFVCRKLSAVTAFEHDVMHLHMDLPDPELNTLAGFPSAFLMLANDLPDLVHTLQALTLTTGAPNPDIGLIFQLNVTTARLQRLLLEPFRSLVTAEGKAKFFGCDLHDAYIQSVSQIIMPGMNYSQALTEKVYNCAKGYKEAGDRALLNGLYSIALVHYEGCQHFLRAVNVGGRFSSGESGQECSQDRLMANCEVNAYLCSLKAGELIGSDSVLIGEADWILENPSFLFVDNDAAISEPVWTLWYHCRGIALAIKGDDRGTLVHLEKALQHSQSDNAYIKRHITVAKGRLSAESREQRETLGSIRASDLPDTPAALEPLP